MQVPKKRFSRYADVMRDAWFYIWRRPLAFLPMVYRLLGIFIIGLFVLFIVWLLAGKTGLVTDFSRNSKAAVIILFVFLLLLFEFHVKSVQALLFSTIATHKKVEIIPLFKKSFSLYRRVAYTMSMLILVGAVIASLIYGLFILSTSLAGVDSWTPVVMVLVGIIAILGFALALIFCAWFSFWLPIIVFEHKSPFETLKQCVLLLRFDGRFVWPIYLIKLAMILGIGAILTMTSAILKGQLGQVPLWWDVAHFILNCILMTWMSLYTFRAFVVRYEK
jgi:hypothetical protein